MAIKHIKNLKPTSVADDLILYDRGYASAENIELLISSRKCFVMRLRKKFNLKADRAGLGITPIIFPLSTGSVKLNVIKFTLPSGEIETLLSNLPIELSVNEYLTFPCYP